MCIILLAEGCLWWLPAIQNLPHCSYLLDCQGVQCINYYETVETSSVFIGERCADPIAVQLELADHDDVIVFRGNFTESSVFRSVLGQGVYTGHVDISRSDTELNFSVSRFSYYRKIMLATVMQSGRVCGASYSTYNYDVTAYSETSDKGPSE